jgi:hypothetical protein
MISEKAKNYADGKVLEALTAAVENAYTDGYKAGYNDAVEKLNNGAQELESDGITYVDLGLPSGTLWTLKYFEDEEENTNYLPYVKAAKLGLPTKEQVDELIEKCRWQGEFSSTRVTFYGANCIGATGEKISFYSSGYKENDERIGAPNYGGGNAYFWIYDEEDGDEKNAVRIYDVENGKPKLEIVKIFSGYKLPVLIVRKRNQ